MNFHALRRIIHMTIVLVPFLYYYYGNTVANYVGFSKKVIVLFILFIILCFEFFRIKKQWRVFGQRPYEAHQISAAVWASISISFVLLLTPEVGRHGAALSAPLIISLALVDPFLGEFRELKIPSYITYSLGLLVCYAIWFLCYFYLGTPLLFSYIIPPITILAELPNFQKIDDNFLMVMIPWLVVMIVYGL